MIITDETYNDLKSQIEAGNFLMNAYLPVSLPQLPEEASDDTNEYYEKCQDTLLIYQAKIKAMVGQMESLRKIVDEKGATDRANSLVANYDKKLEEEYLRYKDMSEGLRRDLAEAKDISANALRRCDDYKEQVTLLQEKIKSLEKTIVEKDQLLVEYYGADLPLVVEIDGEPTKLLSPKPKKGRLAQQLKEKEEEIAALRESQEAIVKDTMENVAIAMIQTGKDHLTDVKKVKDNEVRIGENVLKHIVSDYCADHFDQDTLNKLKILFFDIADLRDHAKAEIAEKTAPVSTTVNIKQLNTGSGTFHEQDGRLLDEVLPQN